MLPTMLTSLSPAAQLGLLIAATLLVSFFGYRLIRQWMVHRSPERREQRRRLWIHREGRLGDALITSADESTIYYAYSVHGVQYEASQDVTHLRDRMPASPERLIGVANLKYVTNNPANSILLCEEWSGLRAPREAARQPEPAPVVDPHPQESAG